MLEQGTGVKKNRTLGLELLEKAADMVSTSLSMFVVVCESVGISIMGHVCFSQGSVEALNGIGWYYSTIVKDKTKAFRYFELAAQNGSRDGLFNVGIYYLNGDNPDKPDRNEVRGYTFEGIVQPQKYYIIFNHLYAI